MLSLGAMQGALAGLYALDVEARVEDHLGTLDPADPEAHRGEVLLVRHDPHEDVAELALLLDPATREALGRGALSWSQWLRCLEGVSHFVMVCWRVDRARPVSELELELQAEVDKFVVSVLLLSRPSGELAGSARRVWEGLFAAPRFYDEANTLRGQRYRAASRAAARYTRAIGRRYLRRPRIGALLTELRAYYRASLEDKLRAA